MKHKKIKTLDLEVYSSKLKNGLEVYIIPDKRVNNTYCTYNTRYGASNNDFKVNNKFVSMPYGIAHFLEHKMFEQEDKNDVFNFFSERGSDANANTNQRKTTYLFSGPNNFYENLEFLLDYVEHPYFTDENVEKEKGIILEELEMNEDNPYRKLMQTLSYNAFINDPLKHPVIGTRESIKRITKEELYTCYNMFYHPSNMYLVITGNVDVKKTYEIIKKHEEKRKVFTTPIIELKKIKEPNKVEKEREIVKMDVTIPKLGIAFKIPVKGLSIEEKQILYSSLTTILDLKISSTSLFYEELRNKNILTDEIDVGGIIGDDHLLIIITVETKEPNKIEKLILNELKDLKVSKEDFERRKKTAISGLLNLSDNIFKVNGRIVNEILMKKYINYDPIKLIRSLEYNEITNKINKLDLSNKTVCIIKPIK